MEQSSERNRWGVTRREAAKHFAEIYLSDDKGHEDQDRQTFWNELLARVFGIEEVSRFVEFEKPVSVKNAQTGKVTQKSIDGYIPSTKVILEMKGKNKRTDEKITQSDGTKLTAFEQAWRYSNNMPHDEQPRWIVVSNFTQIDVHDMNHPHDAPKVIMLADLPDKYHELEFLVDEHKQKVIEEQQVSVAAGELVSKIYDALLKAYAERMDTKDPRVQKSLNMLIVRLVFLLYADDTDWFGKAAKHGKLFQDYIEQFPASQLQAKLVDLFKVLNQPESERDPFMDEQRAAFPYVNGGLFEDTTILIPQFSDELRNLLIDQAGSGFNWAGISPTIFGAVFESTLNPETRRQGGMHYTSVDNIHKVIDPLFLDDLRAELKRIVEWSRINERAQMAKRFRDKLGKLTFFDPACGSGNFLTETYLSLREMEDTAIELIMAANKGQVILGVGDFADEFAEFKVKITNFYGIEINDFAVAVAKTAMWIAESQTMVASQNKGIYVTKDFLPLTSNTGIYEGNALQMDWTEIVKPYALSYIMGNPPFVGLSSLPTKDKELKKQQTQDMRDVFGKLPKIGKLDYVSAWYEKAAHFMIDTTIKAAFVSTNSITQGEQVGILWKHLLGDDGLTINFAWRSFIWNNEASDMAHVHCVIIGFSYQKEQPVIYDLAHPEGVAAKHINGYLLDRPDEYIQSRKTTPPYGLPAMHKGSQPTDGGGLIIKTEQEAQAFKQKYPELKSAVKLYLGSSELIKGTKRYCLWLDGVNPELYARNKDVRKRFEIVKVARSKSSTDSVKYVDIKTPYLFTQRRQPNQDYLAVPEVSSERREYIPVAFLSKDVIASNKLYLIPTAEKWIFAVLSSSLHMTWMRMVAGRLEMRFSYSPAVYANFPWLDFTDQDKTKLNKTADQILAARQQLDASLKTLYDKDIMQPELRKAHTANDRAVLKIYGLKPSADEQEMLNCLFDLKNNTK